MKERQGEGQFQKIEIIGKWRDIAVRRNLSRACDQRQLSSAIWHLIFLTTSLYWIRIIKFKWLKFTTLLLIVKSYILEKWCLTFYKEDIVGFLEELTKWPTAIYIIINKVCSSAALLVAMFPVFISSKIYVIYWIFGQICAETNQPTKRKKLVKHSTDPIILWSSFAKNNQRIEQLLHYTNINTTKA